MFYFLLCASLFVFPTTLSSVNNKEPKEKVRTNPYRSIVSPFFEIKEFYGSIDYNRENKISFYHYPSGAIRPAVIYIHPLIFKNKKQNFNFDNYLDKNVRITGEIVVVKGIAHIAVDEIDILILGE